MFVFNSVTKRFRCSLLSTAFNVDLFIFVSNISLFIPFMFNLRCLYLLNIDHI